MSKENIEILVAYLIFQAPRKRRVRDMYGNWVDEKELEGRTIQVTQPNQCNVISYAQEICCRFAHLMDEWGRLSQQIIPLVEGYNILTFLISFAVQKPWRESYEIWLSNICPNHICILLFLDLFGPILMIFLFPACGRAEENQIGSQQSLLWSLQIDSMPRV